MSDNPYELLGVSSTASDAAIKAAYRELVRVHHPDAGGDAELFISITRAYTILMSPDLRSEFDEMGEVKETGIQRERHAIGEILSVTLDAVLNAAGDKFDYVDMVQSMRSTVHDGLGKLRQEIGQMRRRLDQFEALDHRIKRVDEEKNIFSEVIASKTSKMRKDLAALQTEERHASLALEELQGYESIVDVIRTFQAGSFFAHTGRMTFFGIDMGAV